jgi:hypothetical protein
LVRTHRDQPQHNVPPPDYQDLYLITREWTCVAAPPIQP